MDETNTSTQSSAAKPEQVDFFNEATSQAAASLSNLTPVQFNEPTIVDKSHEGPSVSGALFSGQDGDGDQNVPSLSSGQIKSNILQKKPVQQKKVGRIWIFSLYNLTFLSL